LKSHYLYQIVRLGFLVVVQFEKGSEPKGEIIASQENLKLRAVRTDPSRRKERLVDDNQISVFCPLRWREADRPLPPSQPFREKISLILITFFPQGI